MHVHESCLFSKFAEEGETGVHGNILAERSFVVGVLCWKWLTA